MPYRHGKDTKVLVGQFDLSAYINEANPSMSLETAETSTFGTSAKTYITGQNDGTISFSGFFDGDANAIAEVFENIIATDATPVITIAYDGGYARGNRASLAQGKQTSYEVSAPVSDVVSLNGEFQVTGGLRQGVLLIANVTDSSSTNQNEVDNATSTSIGATANLHVTANTRNANSVIKVQHSADKVTWADLITFTTVSATTTTSQSLTASGTVNRYLRVTSTLSAGTGSITYTVALSRRNN